MTEQVIKKGRAECCRDWVSVLACMAPDFLKKKCTTSFKNVNSRVLFYLQPSAVITHTDGVGGNRSLLILP